MLSKLKASLPFGYGLVEFDPSTQSQSFSDCGASHVAYLTSSGASKTVRAGNPSLLPFFFVTERQSEINTTFPLVLGVLELQFGNPRLQQVRWRRLGCAEPLGGDHWAASS